MLDAHAFRNAFDAQGQFKSGTGELDVELLSPNRRKYPGKLRFKNGLLVGVESQGVGSWAFADESPIDGLKLVLDFPPNPPLAVLVDRGHSSITPFVPNHMYRNAFIKNLRTARNLFIHEQQSNNNGSASGCRGALWLTPKAVSGFRIEDFPKLNEEAQQELTNAVRDFLSVANQVPEGQTPTPEQYQAGESAFVAIFEVMKLFVPVTIGQEMIEAAMKKIALPNWVINWDYEFGTNHNDEECIWIKLILDEATHGPDVSRFANELVSELRQTFVEKKIDIWPYVRLQTSPEFQAV